MKIQLSKIQTKGDNILRASTIHTFVKGLHFLKICLVFGSIVKPEGDGPLFFKDGPLIAYNNPPVIQN